MFHTILFFFARFFFSLLSSLFCVEHSANESQLRNGKCFQTKMVYDPSIDFCKHIKVLQIIFAFASFGSHVSEPGRKSRRRNRTLLNRKERRNFFFLYTFNKRYSLFVHPQSILMRFFTFHRKNWHVSSYVSATFHWHIILIHYIPLAFFVWWINVIRTKRQNR